MLSRRSRSGLKAPSPYQRIAAGGTDGWMLQSRLRQLFRRDLEPDEVAVAVSEVTAVLEGTQRRTVRGWVAATDRALHLRFLVGADLQQGIRVCYDEMKHVELSGAEAAEVHVTYFAPHQVTSKIWYQHLYLRDLTAPGFGTTLEDLVGPRMPDTPATQESPAEPTAATKPVTTPATTAARVATHIGRIARRRPGRHRRGTVAAS
ncbi:MAG TPA: hypothetical protein VNP20_15355 [Nocardioidaceae bacterium]|nr:hypothetical protein [Nocardioidaceae bacterium]